MRRIFAQARKELTQLVRDPLALGLALVLPVVLLLLQSTAISLTVKDLPIVVQDLDQSMASQKLVDAFRNSLSFHIVSWPPDKQPQLAFAANKARGALGDSRRIRPPDCSGRRRFGANVGGWIGCEHRPDYLRRCAGDRTGI